MSRNSRLCLSKTLLAISSPGLQLISTPVTNVSTTWRSIHLLQYVISNSLRKNRPRKSSRWRWFNGRKSPPSLLLHANERNNRDGIVPRMDLSISDEDASSSTGSCAHWCVGTRYRIFEINIQVARREGEKSASLDAACLCVCVRATPTYITQTVYVMRFNIDQLYTLGFGEEAVRLYLEATDNNEGKQVTGPCVCVCARNCMIK